MDRWRGESSGYEPASQEVQVTTGEERFDAEAEAYEFFENAKPELVLALYNLLIAEWSPQDSAEQFEKKLWQHLNGALQFDPSSRRRKARFDGFKHIALFNDPENRELKKLQRLIATLGPEQVKDQLLAYWRDDPHSAPRTRPAEIAH